MKAVQTFSKEYLKVCRRMKPDQIAEFLENFRMLQGTKIFEGQSKLISIKIPEPLLATFRRKCEAKQIPYQTQIKQLMREWLVRGD